MRWAGSLRDLSRDAATVLDKVLMGSTRTFGSDMVPLRLMFTTISFPLSPVSTQPYERDLADCPVYALQGLDAYVRIDFLCLYSILPHCRQLNRVALQRKVIETYHIISYVQC